MNWIEMDRVRVQSRAFVDMQPLDSTNAWTFLEMIPNSAIIIGTEERCRVMILFMHTSCHLSYQIN